MMFDLDSHLNPSLFKKNYTYKHDNKKKYDEQKKKKLIINGRSVSMVNNNLQLPPIK